MITINRTQISAALTLSLVGACANKSEEAEALVQKQSASVTLLKSGTAQKDTG